ncbi:MAG: TldD/PmbA family protein [Actinomycetia bacterium]|nr:TldD/PmbA family protein [Actinomycetes bacterium]
MNGRKMMVENKRAEFKGKELLRVCKKAAAGIPQGNVDQWEVFAARGIENDIEVFNGKIETLSFSDSTGIGIRIFKDHSIGYAYTAVLEVNAIEDAIGKAIANSRITKKDPLNYLPIPEDHRYKNSELNSSMLFDEDFLKSSIDRKIAMAVELESLTKKADKRITGISDVIYNDAISEVCMLNSNGFSGNYNSTIAMVYVSAISRDGEDTSTGDYFGIARNPAEIDLEEIAGNAAGRSVAILGGKKIKSGRMDIILDPMIAARFMGVIASTLDADSVQKGKSLFKDKLGKKVFKINIDIFDDGTLPDGLASGPFDGEGVIKGKTSVFEEGILKTFLYDTYTARKDKTLSTGNASRASYRSTPAVGVSNFYINPGKHDPEDMIKLIDKGFYIMDIIGLGSGTNPISGQMSVGAKGLMIEKGSLTYPVKEVTIATDILSFLSGFKMLGNDLKFVPSGGYLGSPSVLVENIAISGI